jgi:hypothetical protein
MAHHTLIYRGKVEIPKHENKAIRGYVHNRDAAIAIDWTTLQSVYTWTQPGMAPGRCTTDRAHPTVRTLGSYGPILHPVLKTVPLRRDDTRTVKCTHVATQESLWEGGLTSTSPPLIPRYPAGRYASCNILEFACLQKCGISKNLVWIWVLMKELRMSSFFPFPSS